MILVFQLVGEKSNLHRKTILMKMDKIPFRIIVLTKEIDY